MSESIGKLRVIVSANGRELDLCSVPMATAKTKSGGTTVRFDGGKSSVSIPVPRDLPLSIVSGFALGEESATARDGRTGGRTTDDGTTVGQKPKRYATLNVYVGRTPYALTVQVSADPRKPEEWSAYVSASEGHVAAVDFSASPEDLAALLG